MAGLFVTGVANGLRTTSSIMRAESGSFVKQSLLIIGRIQMCAEGITNSMDEGEQLLRTIRRDYVFNFWLHAILCAIMLVFNLKALDEGDWNNVLFCSLLAIAFAVNVSISNFYLKKIDAHLS